MKKQLLSVLAAISLSAFAQVPSVDWPTNQHAIFPAVSPTTAAPNKGVKFMEALDANNVWVIGRDYSNSRNWNWYSRSTNGGALFAGGNIYNDTTTFITANLEAIDANTAWVCAFKKVGPGGQQGGGAIHRTVNGGANWVNMTAPGMFTNTASFANWVVFFTPMVGVANGDPVNGGYEMWRTINGGLSWTPIPAGNIPPPLPGEFAIVNLYATLGSSNLWFGTNGNRMFRSIDGGITYSVSSIGPVTNTITEIAFSSPSNGCCFMINSGFGLELWNTYDGGANWSQITPLPANLGEFDITPIPGTGNIASYGATVGNSLISYSGDNGLTWTDWGSTGIPYVTGSFVDGTTAWAGSFNFVDGNNVAFNNIWKYTGPAITGTVLPSASFTVPLEVCMTGGSAAVIPGNMSTGSGVLSYLWNVSPAGPSISNPNAAAPTINFSAPGTYTIILTTSNNVGNNTTYWTVDVISCSAPVPTFTVDAAACSGFTVVPNNTSAGTPAPAYYWSVSPATNATVSSATAMNPNIQLGSGTYTISLLTSNASGTAVSTQVVNSSPCLAIPGFTMPSIVCWEDAVPTTANKIFNTFNTSANPPGVTGGNMTYTWSIKPPAGVSVLPSYTSQHLTQVKITNVTTTTQYTVTLMVRNPSGTVSYSSTINAGKCTGVSENTLASDLLVFPNPAHEQINVVLPASTNAYSVRLTNILGSVVYEDKAIKGSKETTVISLNNKPKGVYFLTVESNSEKVTKKIVVE